MTPDLLPTPEQDAAHDPAAILPHDPSAAEPAPATLTVAGPAERIEREPAPAATDAPTTTDPIASAAPAAGGESPPGEPGVASPRDAVPPGAPSLPDGRDLLRAALQERLLARLDRSRRLPPGLRQKLAAQIQAAEAGAEGGELPSLRLSDAIAWLEESLPAHVALLPDELGRPDHPRGEGFFRDDTSGLTDDEAARIAREQVSRAGLARK